MCGLRHLFHGLTSAGVAAEHYADLLAQDKECRRKIDALEAAMERAKEAKATAGTTWVKLRTKLIALRQTDPDEQSTAAQTLAVEVAVAEDAYRDASDTVKDRRKAIDRNDEQLKRVQSQIDALRGVLFASCL